MRTDNTSAVVIGGGPAGLMAAERLAHAGHHVDLYDAMPSVARKFLLAGIGGMNITHAEQYSRFVTRYSEAETWLKPKLDCFGPDQLRDWIHSLGVNTVIGSSGRVFPEEMKAAPLLRRWKHRLSEMGVCFHPRHKWLGWSGSECVQFMTPSGEVSQTYKVLVLALGGGSWRKLGSDGGWVDTLESSNVNVSPLIASNCGWIHKWSDHFIERAAGKPIKHVGLSVKGQSVDLVSEIMITNYGLEGTGIYAIGRYIRAAMGDAVVCLDLLPQRSADSIYNALKSSSSKDSLSNKLRKVLKLSKEQIALLNEIGPVSSLDLGELVARIKCIELSLNEHRPIDEAISTAGGVRLDAVDKNLMLHSLPGVFVAGEMLDWDAPTGGYLLTACLSTGYAAGEGANHWIETGKDC